MAFHWCHNVLLNKTPNVSISPWRMVGESYKKGVLAARKEWKLLKHVNDGCLIQLSILESHLTLLSKNYVWTASFLGTVLNGICAQCRPWSPWSLIKTGHNFCIIDSSGFSWPIQSQKGTLNRTDSYLPAQLRRLIWVFPVRPWPKVRFCTTRVVREVADLSLGNFKRKIKTQEGLFSCDKN